MAQVNFINTATGKDLDRIAEQWHVYRCFDSSSGDLDSDQSLRAALVAVMFQGERRAPLQNTEWQRQQDIRPRGNRHQQARKPHGFDKNSHSIVCVEYRETARHAE
jgi:hypothetical protein